MLANARCYMSPRRRRIAVVNLDTGAVWVAHRATPSAASEIMGLLSSWDRIALPGLLGRQEAPGPRLRVLPDRE